MESTEIHEIERKNLIFHRNVELRSRNLTFSPGRDIGCEQHVILFTYTRFGMLYWKYCFTQTYLVLSLSLIFKKPRELHRGALSKRRYSLSFSLSFLAFYFIGLLADVVLAEAEKWPSQRRYGESYRRDSREFPRNILEFLTRADRAASHVAVLKSRAYKGTARVLRFACTEEARILRESTS